MSKEKKIRKQRNAEDTRLLTEKIKYKIPEERCYLLAAISFSLLIISAVVWVLFDTNTIYYDPFFYADFFDCCSAPLLSFALTEYFYNNKCSHGKTIMLLGVIAFICEPFKDFVTLDINVWQKQNIFFSLCVGYIILTLLHTDATQKLSDLLYKKLKLAKFWGAFFKISFIILFVTLASLLNFEYGFRFAVLVLLFDWSRNRKHIKLFQALIIVLFIVSYQHWYYMNTACVLTLPIIYSVEKQKEPSKINSWLDNLFSKKAIKITSIAIYPFGMIAASVLKCFLI